MEKIIELTQGGVHHAIECVGLKKTAKDAFRMLRPGGTATIVGMIPVDFHLQGRLQLERLISGRLRLEQINEGFDALQRGGVTRSIVEFAA